MVLCRRGHDLFQECIDDTEKWRRNVTVAKRIINGLLAFFSELTELEKQSPRFKL